MEKEGGDSNDVRRAIEDHGAMAQISSVQLFTVCYYTTLFTIRSQSTNRYN